KDSGDIQAIISTTDVSEHWAMAGNNPPPFSKFGRILAEFESSEGMTFLWVKG
ncbi:MAG: hypothetical protein RI953_765, partial [Pseudomonadota bacterium]